MEDFRNVETMALQKPCYTLKPEREALHPLFEIV